MGLPSSESIVAFVVGASSVGGVWLKGRGSREAAFNARYDERFKALEAEVEACREERPVIAILKMGLLMIVPELQQQDPRNPVLKQVANAFTALPQDNSSFDELLKQLNQIPGTREMRGQANA